MYPTLFKIPFLPDWLADIKSYGVMMMIAFLSGIYLACRRAYKSQADPDVVLNVGFLSLIFGVIGARLMFVIHYWDTNFANQPNPLFAIFDIRSGGLEFWGGPLLVIPAVAIYLLYFAKASPRWYLDITMPSLAWGLAITRVGCFLNGCCWGSPCTDPNAHDHGMSKAALPWAVTFPYGSPAMAQQYKYGQITLPKELIFIQENEESLPLPRESIEAAAEHNRADEHKEIGRQLSSAQMAYDTAVKNKAPKEEQAGLHAEYKRLEKEHAVFGKPGETLVYQHCEKFGITPQELLDVSRHYRSRPIHPSQLYAVINGFIICWVLTIIFYIRKRHGAVIGWFLILYSISRIFLELIRQDNPLDTAGLTISQGISICTFLAGVAWLLLLQRLPMRSPLVKPWIPPDDEEDEKMPKARKATK